LLPLLPPHSERAENRPPSTDRNQTVGRTTKTIRPPHKLAMMYQNTHAQMIKKLITEFINQPQTHHLFFSAHSIIKGFSASLFI